MPSWSPPHRAMSQAMRGLANHRSVHDVRGLSRILWRTGTRPFWHGGAASSCSCASSSGGGAASSGSCTTASGCACCDTATHSGLTWRGGGTWRSAAAGVRNWHGARLGGIVGNEVIEQWWYRWTLAARTSDSCIDALPFLFPPSAMYFMPWHRLMSRYVSFRTPRIATWVWKMP